MDFKKKQLFNPKGNDSVDVRKMVGGDITNILNLNDVKYSKISKLYKVMRENFWIPEKFPLSQDTIDIKNISDDELEAYKGILGFLTFLDSVQTNNIPNIAQYITSAEVVLALTEQASQEALHSNSYAYIFESVLEKDEINDVYDYWRTDNILLDRVSYIAEGFQEFLDNDSEENFKKVVVLNYLLEGLYFYNGFQFFYLLSSRGLMSGTADIIKLIQKDEECLHPETEVLTSVGWKHIEHITLNDDVAQFDIETNEITFSKPLHKTWKHYSGDMVLFEGECGKFRQNVTEDHDMLVKSISHKTKKENIKKVKAKDLKMNSNNFSFLSGISNRDCRDFNDYDRFIIALQADGTIDKKRTGKFTGCQQVKFTLTKERKIKRLIDIVSSLGWKYKHNQYNKCVIVVYVPTSYKISKRFNNHVELDKINTTYIKLFLKELTHWDGYYAHNENNNTPTMYFEQWDNTNKDDVDVVQAMLSMSGFKHKTKKKIDNREDRYKDVYRVWWFENKEGNENLKPLQNISKNSYSYDGMVGCVTMSKGTLITRNNESVSIVGNCHLVLFEEIINDVFNIEEDGEMIVDLFRKAVDQEITWSNHIIGDKILGMTKDSIEQHTKYLANKRLNKIGIDNIYFDENGNDYKNPFTHLEIIADSNGEGSSKTNFFESSVTSYNQSTVISGWELIDKL